MEPSSVVLVPPATKSFDFIPLIYGSIAFSLGKTDDGTTHRWSIYVRGVDGKDLSGVVSKVVFKLHPTCTSPVVECIQHPFETTQPGWGEFPAGIEVTFRDESKSSVSFTHSLRLHAVGMTGPVTKPVVHEVYEEVVFKSMNTEFQDMVRSYHSTQCPIPSHPHSVHWQNFSDENDVALIGKAHAFVKQELDKAIREHQRLENEIKLVEEKRLAMPPVAQEVTQEQVIEATPAETPSAALEATSKRLKLDEED